MNDYKKLLVLKLALENCLDVDTTKGQYYQLKNIDKWVNRKLVAIEDKEKVVKRLTK